MRVTAASRARGRQRGDRLARPHPGRRPARASRRRPAGPVDPAVRRDLHGHLRAAARSASSASSTRSGPRATSTGCASISDDCSSSGRFAELHRLIGDDPRFVVSRSPRRQGFYLNFERALSMVPAEAGYVALADQDDHWHADKLERLLAAIDGAQLVYSDARIVSRTGEPIAETYWTERRNNHEDLLSVLVANSVTGAASLFRRDLLDDALPFPPAQFSHFHDHWIALTALARGEIAFVDRPAVRIRAARRRVPRARGRKSPYRARRPARVAAPRSPRAGPSVAAALLRRRLPAAPVRDGPRAAISAADGAGQAGVLDRFRHADRSLVALTALGLRGARDLFGAHETLGAEWMLIVRIRLAADAAAAVAVGRQPTAARCRRRRRR